MDGRVTIAPDRSVRYELVDGTREWPSLAALANDYWTWQRLDPGSRRNIDMSAWSCVEDLIESSHTDAVLVLRALADAAADDAELTTLGAGPLERLVSHQAHGLRFALEIEFWARHNDRFRRMVSGLWMDSDVPAEVRERLAPVGARDLTSGSTG